MLNIKAPQARGKRAALRGEGKKSALAKPRGRSCRGGFRVCQDRGHDTERSAGPAVAGPGRRLRPDNPYDDTDGHRYGKKTAGIYEVADMKRHKET